MQVTKLLPAPAGMPSCSLSRNRACSPQPRRWPRAGVVGAGEGDAAPRARGDTGPRDRHPGRREYPDSCVKAAGLSCMEQMPYQYGSGPRRPGDNDRAPLAVIAPAIATTVVFVEGLVTGWLVWLTPALCGNSCDNDHYQANFSFGLTVGACGLIVPAGLLLISWVLPWRRRHNGSRVAAAVLALVPLTVLYVLFNIFLALA